ncbi:hypothetical protein [Erwinia mallotivora]|uniref:Uncharacterized protein n=1 Tax=Erwinia mallotivora TaxID=69222 RepID=A0A014PWD0_9GAMM|nr:hypothetical protein [Erwinia mallotivora]EXU75172.1 hypothetical protein BG55_12825 [Erwinia mallotivora]
MKENEQTGNGHVSNAAPNDIDKVCAGIVTAEGIIDGLSIKCDVHLKYECNNTKQPPEDIKLKSLNPSKLNFYFASLLSAMFLAMVVDFVFDKNNHLTLFFLPIVVGLILFIFIDQSPTADIKYIKKLVDTVTLLSSTITACILIFKTVDVSNPYLDLIYNLQNLGIFGFFMKALLFIFLYLIVSAFAISATIKCCLSYKDYIEHKV